MTTDTQRAMLASLPNLLTLARLPLSAALFAMIALDLWIAALIVYALAALTDWLDGFLARRWKQTSSFGRVFDPLVDKVMVCGAFVFLLPHGMEGRWLLPWMVTVVIAREFLITGLRGWLESLGVSFGADWLGKLKMILQCAALAAVFVAMAWPNTPGLAMARYVLIWAMLAATVLSGLQYVWRAVVIFRNDPRKLAG